MLRVKPLFKHPLLPSNSSTVSPFLSFPQIPRQQHLLYRQSIRDPNLHSTDHMSSNSNISATTSLGLESRKRKRRKLNNNNDQLDIDSKSTTTTWRSESNQRIYSTRLLDALRHASDPRNIRAAADRVLAATAKGRTRWSRAILKNHRRRLHLHSKILKKVSKKTPNDYNKFAIGSGNNRIGESSSRRPEKLPAVEKRVRVLGRLVPGCRKLSFPSLLEETTDYIAALEMQVRAMATLAELLTNGGPSLTSGS